MLAAAHARPSSACPASQSSGGVAVLTTAKCATGTSRTGARVTSGIERFDERLELGQLGHAVIVRAALETGVVEEVRGGVVEARHRVHAVVVDAGGAVLASRGRSRVRLHAAQRGQAAAGAAGGARRRGRALRPGARATSRWPAARTRARPRTPPPSPRCSRARASRWPRCARAACTRRSADRRRARARARRPGAHGARAQLLRQPRADAAAREHARAAIPAPTSIPDGPAQADATAAVALACDCEPVIAGDRCGMRAYAVPLRNAALGYLRLAGDGMPEPYAEAARGVAGAMREAPEMVAGPGSFDSLANALPHVVAKRGAMGVFCCASAADRARRRAQGRGRLVRGHGGRRRAVARGGRRAARRGVRPLARASHPRRRRQPRSVPGRAQLCYSPRLL